MNEIFSNEPEDRFGLDRPHSSQCPLYELISLLAKRWTIDVIWLLARHGTMRFGEIRRALGHGVSARVLSGALRSLEQLGAVTRTDLSGSKLHVEYALTETGRELDQALHQSETFAKRLGAVKRTRVGEP